MARRENSVLVCLSSFGDERGQPDAADLLQVYVRFSWFEKPLSESPRRGRGDGSTLANAP